ncbi:transposase [Microbacterium sp. CFH 90308]|uniref:Transposase n=1 Tax=Microbacterium salsuginis TaxID=2722803 RepID=A0ABX1K648_9MICO|nr:transposase [Microbacterium sp. CFH 90308]
MVSPWPSRQGGRIRCNRRGESHPASSGNTTRHRLNRGGDRQLNRALNVIAMSAWSTSPAPAAR